MRHFQNCSHSVRAGRLAPGAWVTLGVAVLFLGLVGCDETPPIRQYTVQTQVPETLLTRDRMLAAIIPRSPKVWFAKMVGPTDAVDYAKNDVRRFVQELRFENDSPDLESLPGGWRQSPGDRPMRFATLLIDTPGKQLELAISDLPRTGDWDTQVLMNVNRWRGQLGLPDSDAPWGGGEVLQAVSADSEPAIWLDLTGQTKGPGAPMGPEATMGPGAPMISGVDGQRGAAKNQSSTSSASPLVPVAASQSASSVSDDKLAYAAPPQWRAGQVGGMRLAEFEIGPAEQTPAAELTIIPAGGDARGNVARWLGQIRGDSPPGDVVDRALEDAETLVVSGRDSQRYFLGGQDGDAAAKSEEQAQAIDVTIVPMEGGMSLFIKATGPEDVLRAERERITLFLESIRIP